MTNRFTKVSSNVWRSARFRKLTDAERLLYMFLISCEHTNSIGAFRLPDGYALDDLGEQWDAAKLKKARDVLVKADLIAFDADSQFYYVRRWFKHSPPMNDKHAQGCLRQIGDLEPDTIAEMVLVDFEEADKARRDNANPIPDAPAPYYPKSEGAQRWPVRIGANR